MLSDIYIYIYIYIYILEDWAAPSAPGPLGSVALGVLAHLPLGSVASHWLGLRPSGLAALARASPEPGPAKGHRCKS